GAFALAERGPQRGVAGQQETFRECAFAEVRKELCDRHRWQRREVMRVHQLQQVLREARKLRVDLELNARRQKGEALEQPLDVRIRDLGALDAEPAGDLRELLRELRAHLPHVLELAVVIAQQTRIHQVSAPRIRSWPWRRERDTSGDSP